MDKKVLEEKIYYYENVMPDFENFVEILKELDGIDSIDGTSLWYPWTASNDKNFIYGETQSFDLNQINQMPEPLKEKMLYVYNAVTDSLYNVSKDYAESLGDHDEPRLFPTFNIKKYYSDISMGSHFDQLDGDKTLRYSLVMYLNDDYEGGEISFSIVDYDGVNKKPSTPMDYEEAVESKGFDVAVKPKANSVIIFPSGAPYFHTAHTVKTGFKYMIPGHWIHNNMEFHKGM